MATSDSDTQNPYAKGTAYSKPYPAPANPGVTQDPTRPAIAGRSLEGAGGGLFPGDRTAEGDILGAPKVGNGERNTDRPDLPDWRPPLADPNANMNPGYVDESGLWKSAETFYPAPTRGAPDVSGLPPLPGMASGRTDTGTPANPAPATNTDVRAPNSRNPV